MMNFNGMFDGADASPFAFGGSSIGKPPGLSLGLDMESRSDMNRFVGIIGGGGGAGAVVSGGDENDSRSGSDNVDGASGDEMDGSPDKSNGGGGSRKRKKRYHRHTPQQIQELEAAFKECPHPDEKQRMELSRRLSLESRQVKFWFQNRRTQLKTQIERHENVLLRQENERLRTANMAIREAMRNPMCSNCGGPAMPGEVMMLEEQHLRVENARLKDELDRVSSLATKFLGRPLASLTSPLAMPLPLELGMGMGSDGFAGMSSVGPTTMTSMPEFLPVLSSSAASGLCLSPLSNGSNLDMHSAGGFFGADHGSVERTMVVDLALAAMEELVKMAQMEKPLWIPADDGVEMLNYDEYQRSFRRLVGPKPSGFVSEATRVSGVVIISSLALVDTLMDANRWAEMFSCVVSGASTADTVCAGVGGTQNGALHLMSAQLQVLSPAVPVGEVSFLRFCKQQAEGLWAVVDVSVDGLRSAAPNGNSLRAAGRVLPSGCLIQETPNGYSKVTWVVHSEYDEEPVHPVYRALLRSGFALGARRWISTLQRQCQCLAILMSSAAAHDNAALTAGGRRSILTLAKRMTCNFCSAVCAAGQNKWQRLEEWGSGGAGEEGTVRMLTRQSVEGAEPSGLVLSAATWVRLPGVAPHRVFDYLRDERRRHEWDILSDGEPMQEMLHVAKGREHGNAVSVLRANNAASGNQASILVLQETCTDASGSMVVFAPVDVPAMHVVMNGGDSAYVAVLPSGFAVVPDCHGRVAHSVASANSTTSGSPPAPAPAANGDTMGSLLTVAFQILVSSSPTAALTTDSVKTASSLLSTTIGKIKSVFHADIVSP